MCRTLKLVAVMVLLFIANVAFADAQVVVQLRDTAGHPADGTITLEAVDKSAKYSCRTSKGTCTINGVPGGNYHVTVKPTSGSAPPPLRKVMIPPSGKVDLFVSTGKAKSDGR